jgi:hypothetical protein
MDEPREASTEDLLSSRGSEPLVPILQTEDGQADPVALATWQQALSNTLAIEVPHDLFGLWLYPQPGGVVLLGPAELAQDDLAIPVPDPHLKPESLEQLEARVTKAGYGSASCVPIGFGKRDVGLMLVADLQADRYGAVERVVLQCVARQVGPMLGRLARQWKPSEGSVSPQQERTGAMLETLAQANRDSATPQRFIATISQGLASLLPHEHVELLVSDQSGRKYFRLGEHSGGPLWADPSLEIDGDHLDIAKIFGSGSQLLVGDTYDEPAWPRGMLTAGAPSGADLRSVVGARLNLKNNVSAFLLVGSIGPEIYGSEDADLVALLAGLVTPQVSEFVRAEGPAAPVARPAENSPHAEQLFRIAGLLATTSDPAVATQLVAGEARTILPFEKLTFALRMTQDRVVLLEPGEQRTLSSLPLVSVAGTALGRTLRGELPCAFGQSAGESRMIVPLRVAGRVHGALIFASKSSRGLNEHHVLPAQHLADIVAAHMELLRRTSMLPHPTVSRWRQAEQH